MDAEKVHQLLSGMKTAAFPNLYQMKNLLFGLGGAAGSLLLWNLFNRMGQFNKAKQENIQNAYQYGQQQGVQANA